MNKHLAVAVLLVWCSSFCRAQLLPLPGGQLNYTQIMFEHPVIPGAWQYTIQVTADTVGADFDHSQWQRTDSAPAAIINGFRFGGRYMWRYAATVKGGRMKWAGPYYFTIANLPQDNATTFDAGYYRAHIYTNNTAANMGGLVVTDLTHTAINRLGQPVWFLPNPEVWLAHRDFMTDLRITPYGTVTFLTHSDAVECDLDGHVLWKAPNDGKVSGDTCEYYNHIFERVADGRYMVVSKKYVWRPVPNLPGYKPVVRYMFDTTTRNGIPMAKLEFSTLVEYDKNGHVTYTWSPENYFINQDIFYPDVSAFDLNNDKGAHMNSFMVDPKQEFIYCGFRNYSRVIKIRRATGEVVYSWGNQMPGGEARDGHGFFLKQHDCQLLKDGNIAVFNNGDYQRTDVPSSVVVFSQDSPSRVVWQFDCNFSSLAVNKSRRRGNVDELDNGNLLVCMGAVPRVFEITRNKQVVWETVFEPINPADSIWVNTHLSRAHNAPSLYPCYFTVQTGKKGQVLVVKIFNVGTNNDSYSIQITTVKGLQKEFSTGEIKSGRSASYDMPVGTAVLATDCIEIKVRSNTNSYLVKVLNMGVCSKD